VTPKGILTKDGVEHELDLLLLCAGFKVQDYLWPVQYTGRGGVTLEQAWEKDGARAYLGMTVPNFPNMFIIYGPNGQASSGGIMKWLEVWTRYAIKSIVRLLEDGAHAMDLKPIVFEHYNARLDEEMKMCIWHLAGQTSYYVNRHGRSGVNMPWHPEKYYGWIREPNLADYDVT
jgi:4-hydroxyacetophenone monooxygenase